MRKGLTWVFWAKILPGGWKGFLIDEWGSHTNHSVACIKERIKLTVRKKMVSTLIWRHVSLLYVVQSNILWLTILLSYHYRCNVVFTNYRFPVSFLLYMQPKKLNRTITVNSSTNTPITKKITLARFACLCFGTV